MVILEGTNTAMAATNCIGGQRQSGVVEVRLRCRGKCVGDEVAGGSRLRSTGVVEGVGALRGDLRSGQVDPTPNQQLVLTLPHFLALPHLPTPPHTLSRSRMRLMPTTPVPQPMPPRW